MNTNWKHNLPLFLTQQQKTVFNPKDKQGGNNEPNDAEKKTEEKKEPLFKGEQFKVNGTELMAMQKRAGLQVNRVIANAIKNRTFTLDILKKYPLSLSDSAINKFVSYGVLNKTGENYTFDLQNARKFADNEDIHSISDFLKVLEENGVDKTVLDNASVHKFTDEEIEKYLIGPMGNDGKYALDKTAVEKDFPKAVYGEINTVEDLQNVLGKKAGSKNGATYKQVRLPQDLYYAYSDDLLMQLTRLGVFASNDDGILIVDPETNSYLINTDVIDEIFGLEIGTFTFDEETSDINNPEEFFNKLASMIIKEGFQTKNDTTLHNFTSVILEKFFFGPIFDEDSIYTRDGQDYYNCYYVLNKKALKETFPDSWQTITTPAKLKTALEALEAKGVNINGEIDEAVSQGATGSCWIISAIESLASTEAGKKIIKNSIKSDGAGGYFVTFKGVLDNGTNDVGENQRAVVIHVTAEEIMSYNSDTEFNAGSDGDDDMLLMEIAFAKLEQGIKLGYYTPKDNSSVNPDGGDVTPGEDNPDDLLGYIEGGWQTRAIYFLTGVESDNTEVTKTEDGKNYVGIDTSDQTENDDGKHTGLSLKQISEILSNAANGNIALTFSLMPDIDNLLQEDGVYEVHQDTEGNYCLVSEICALDINDNVIYLKLPFYNVKWDYSTNPPKPILDKNGKPETDPGKESVGHALTITNVDAKNKTVTVVNPWNSEQKFVFTWDAFQILGIAGITSTDLSTADTSANKGIGGVIFATTYSSLDEFWKAFNGQGGNKNDIKDAQLKREGDTITYPFTLTFTYKGEAVRIMFDPSEKNKNSTKDALENFVSTYETKKTDEPEKEQNTSIKEAFNEFWSKNEAKLEEIFGKGSKELNEIKNFIEKYFDKFYSEDEDDNNTYVIDEAINNAKELANNYSKGFEVTYIIAQLKDSGYLGTELFNNKSKEERAALKKIDLAEILQDLQKCVKDANDSKVHKFSDVLKMLGSLDYYSDHSGANYAYAQVGNYQQDFKNSLDDVAAAVYKEISNNGTKAFTFRDFVEKLIEKLGKNVQSGLAEQLLEAEQEAEKEDPIDDTPDEPVDTVDGTSDKWKEIRAELQTKFDKIVAEFKKSDAYKNAQLNREGTHLENYGDIYTGAFDNWINAARNSGEFYEDYITEPIDYDAFEKHVNDYLTEKLNTVVNSRNNYETSFDRVNQKAEEYREKAVPAFIAKHQDQFNALVDYRQTAFKTWAEVDVKAIIHDKFIDNALIALHNGGNDNDLDTLLNNLESDVTKALQARLDGQTDAQGTSKTLVAAGRKILEEEYYWNESGCKNEKIKELTNKYPDKLDKFADEANKQIYRLINSGITDESRFQQELRNYCDSIIERLLNGEDI